MTQLRECRKVLGAIFTSLFLLGCDEYISEKESFNRDFQDFYMREVDYKDRMNVSESKGILFCSLNNETRLLVKSKTDMNHFYILGDKSMKGKFLQFKDSIFNFEKRNQVSIDNIWYKKAQFYITISDKKDLILPDTILNFEK